MPSSFPTSRDTLTNPTASDPKNSATVPHASQHANANDAIRAMQAALPTTSEGSVPRGTRGYAQVTANQGSITAEVDLTGLSVTVTVGASRRIKITGRCWASSTVGTDQAFLTIYEGTTQLSGAPWGFPGNANLRAGFGEVVVVLTPSSGSHTYKLRLSRPNGTGTITMEASGTAPAWLLVEDIGGTG